MSDHLSSKTVKELKEYAAANGIDLGDAKTKAKILSVLLDVKSDGTVEDVEAAKTDAIVMPERPKRVPVSNSKVNEDGVVVSNAAERKRPANDDSSTKVEKVAIYSEKNMHWTGTGAVQKGYNIVTKEAAEKWLTRKGIRIAEPEEVATFYGQE